jgi:hypothetical protein
VIRRVSVSTSSVIPGAGSHVAVHHLLGGASAHGQTLVRASRRTGRIGSLIPAISAVPGEYR